MPILQIKLTAPTGDVTKAMRQIRADESKAFAVTQRQVNQQRIADQKLYNEKLKGLKDVARARDIDAAAILKQARAQAVANRESDKARRDAERSIRGGRGAGIGSFAAGGVAALLSSDAVGKLNAANRAYSDYTETVNKSSAIFRQNSAEILAWSKNSAEVLGMSQTVALETASSFGNLFDSMGLGSQNTVVMSKRLTTLAADLSSFNNREIQSVIDDLRTGIIGDPEPLRKYGVMLNEQVIKNEAKRLGLIKDTKAALDPVVRTQAIYALLLKQTASAEGDRLKTAKEQAGATRTLTAQLGDLNVKLGKELAPTYAKVIGLASEFATTLNKVTPEQIETIKQIATPIAIIGGGAAGLFLAAKGVTAISAAMKALSISGPGGLVILGGLITAASILQRMNSESDLKNEQANTTFAQNLRGQANERGTQIAALRGYQQYRKGNAPRVLDPMSPEHQGLKAAGLTGLATPEQIEAAIRKLSADQQKFNTQAARQQQIANKGAGATNVDTPLPPVNLTGNVTVPVIPKGAGAGNGAAAKKAAKDLAGSNTEAAERSRNSYGIAFDEALATLGFSTDLAGSQSELQRLSRLLKAQDVNVAKVKRAGTGGSKTGQQEYLTSVGKARQDFAKRTETIGKAIEDAQESILKAWQNDGELAVKESKQNKELRDKNRENQLEYLKQERDRLEYLAEDAKVTGNLAKQKETLKQLYDNELATLRAQYQIDRKSGVPIGVALGRFTTGQAAAGRTFASGVGDVQQDAWERFQSNGGMRARLAAEPTQGQKDRLAVSETLRQVFADAGSAAGPAFFEGMLSGDGGKARNAFKMFGQDAASGFARKLSETLADRPIQKAFDDIANKIADGGKIAGINLYQGAMAIYSAAQALAAARKGNGTGLLGFALGAIGGALIPGIGPLAGGSIVSNLFQGNIAGAGLAALGTDFASNGLARIGGSGIQIPSDASSSDANPTRSVKRSAKAPGGDVSVVYNMYGDINDRQDAERARRARTNELRDALAMT